MRYVPIVLIVVIKIASFAESPQEALREMAFATDFKRLLAHLPPSIEEELRKAPPEVARQIADHFTAERARAAEMLRIEAGDGDELIRITKLGETPETATVAVERWISDGVKAYLRLKMCQQRECHRLGDLWMEYEDGSWRLQELFSERLIFRAQDLIHRLRQAPFTLNEEAAIGSVRTFNTAQVTYASTYENGFSPTLESLGGSPECAPSAATACLIDNTLASGEKSGYRFTYRWLGNEAYTVIARPAQYGTTGKRSFFSDESGVIRFTDEDREPSVDDDPVQ